MFSKDGNQHNISIFTPPHPIKQTFYRCDPVFHVDRILFLYDNNDEHIAVLHLKGQCSVIYKYLPKLDSLTQVARYQTKLQKNHSMGGQSQNRIMRLRENAIHEYLKKIQELLTKYTQNSCIGIIIIGHGVKPQQFSQYLDSTQSELLLDTVTADMVNLDQIHSIMQKQTYSSYSEELNKLDSLIQTDIDRLAFGQQEIDTLLPDGMLSDIYDNTDNEDRREMCKEMGVKYHVIPYLKYRLCGIRWYSDSY